MTLIPKELTAQE